MESEFLQLAREAVAALQGPTPPTWTDVAAVTVGFLQVGLIAWGLRQMGKSSKERNRQLDQQAETLGKIGQALDRQGAAMTQAFTQQGEVLAELLRRST